MLRGGFVSCVGRRSRQVSDELQKSQRLPGPLGGKVVDSVSARDELKGVLPLSGAVRRGWERGTSGRQPTEQAG